MTEPDEPIAPGHGGIANDDDPPAPEAASRRTRHLVRLGIPLLLVAATVAGVVVAERHREPSRVSSDLAVATAMGHLRWQHPELQGWKVASVRYQDGGTRVADPFGGSYTTDAAHPFHGWVVAVTAPPQGSWAVIHGAVLVDGRTDRVQSSGVSELNPAPHITSG